MILIIGGACQGKTEYAQTHFGKNCKMIDQYHLRVRKQMENGQEPLKEAERLLEELSAQDQRELIIISDEIGYGLVPVDAFLREYRETSGRVNCYFAKEAEQVIRVMCGIGTRIK